MPEPVIKIFIGIEVDGEETVRGRFNADEIAGKGCWYIDRYIAQVFRQVCEAVLKEAGE